MMYIYFYARNNNTTKEFCNFYFHKFSHAAAERNLTFLNFDQSSNWPLKGSFWALQKKIVQKFLLKLAGSVLRKSKREENKKEEVKQKKLVLDSEVSRGLPLPYCKVAN